MTLHRRSLRAVAFALTAVVLLTVPWPASTQSVEPPPQPAPAAQDAGQDRARLVEFLSRDDVRRQMEELGIDADAAALRADSLSDDEVRQIAAGLDDLPSDQSSLFAVVAVAIACVVMLLVTELLGYTKIFSFLKAKKHE